LVELDIFSLVKDSKLKNRKMKALSDLIDIFQYLHTCSCENCRSGEKILKYWLKIIREKDNYYYIGKDKKWLTKKQKTTKK